MTTANLSPGLAMDQDEENSAMFMLLAYTSNILDFTADAHSSFVRDMQYSAAVLKTRPWENNLNDSEELGLLECASVLFDQRPDPRSPVLDHCRS